MNLANKKALDQLAKELKAKFTISDQENITVLEDDLKDAMVDALDYCNRDTIIGNMSSAVKDIYIFRRNTEGVEGEMLRSEGGVSQSFEVGIPRKIRSKLNRYRIAKVRSL